MLYDPPYNYTMQNRERAKAGETRQIQYTIVFQKKDGAWTDQFGKEYEWQKNEAYIMHSVNFSQYSAKNE